MNWMVSKLFTVFWNIGHILNHKLYDLHQQINSVAGPRIQHIALRPHLIQVNEGENAIVPR